MELSEKEVGVAEANRRGDLRYNLRKAARAVLFNTNDQVALMFVAQYNYHKLPGGGIEPGETVLEALKREILEEAGFEIGSWSELGMVIEYRNWHQYLQISYGYKALVMGEQKPVALTQWEKEQGAELKWVALDEAIGILRKEDPQRYGGKFIRKRDLAFLEKAKSLPPI